MTEQEMQMMLLMAAAKGGNKNLSGVLGNMDNQLLAIMAGAYDPRTAEQSGPGAGSYWSRYSQSENPIIQDVISKITSGADKFQISSYIDSIAAPGVDLGGFQVADLKGVASELYKEYTGTTTGSSSSKNKTATQKAGIPDPTELYNTSTVPLSSINEQYIRKLQEDLKPKVSNYGNVSYDVSAARRNLERDVQQVDRGTLKNQQLEYLRNREGIKTFPLYNKDSKGNNMGIRQYDELMADVESGKSAPFKGVKTRGELVPYASTNGKKSKSGYNKDANKKYDDAMLEKVTMEAMMSAANQREQAVREGQMDYARQSGATPTTDAMKMIMKFISSSK